MNYYANGTKLALIKLGFQFSSPGRAVAAHGGAGALLGGGLGASSEESPLATGLAGAAVGGAVGTGIKSLANNFHNQRFRPAIDNINAFAPLHADPAMRNNAQRAAGVLEQVLSSKLRGIL